MNSTVLVTITGGKRGVGGYSTGNRSAQRATWRSWYRLLYNAVQCTTQCKAKYTVHRTVKCSVKHVGTFIYRILSFLLLGTAMITQIQQQGHLTFIGGLNIVS